MVHAALMQAITFALVAWNNKVLKGTSQSYSEFPGGAKATDAAYDSTGKLYIIGDRGYISVFDGTSWTQITSLVALELAPACNGLFLRRSDSNIFSLHSTVSAVYPDSRWFKWNGADWVQEMGHIYSEAVGSDGYTPWMIDLKDKDVYYWDFDVWRMYPAPIKAKKIAVAKDKTPYVIDENDKIMKGTTKDGKKTWVEVPGGKTAKDISVSSTGIVWIVSIEDSEAWYMTQGKWYRHPGGKEGIAIAAP